MKLIIEIPEESWESIKQGTWCGSEYVAKGVPLEPCDDAISRQATIAEICRYECERKHEECTLHEGHCRLIKTLEEMPSVHAVPKTWHWIGCGTCILDGTDACLRGTGDNEVCEGYISRSDAVPKTESCEDAISRQAALNELEYHTLFWNADDLRMAVDVIKDLPSVHAVPRTEPWHEKAIAEIDAKPLPEDTDEKTLNAVRLTRDYCVGVIRKYAAKAESEGKDG